MTAQCFPVGEFIRDEMEARGWDVPMLASKMDPNNGPLWILTLELLIECSDDERIVVGQETAEALARAFGTSPTLWVNLNNAYQSWRNNGYSSWRDY